MMMGADMGSPAPSVRYGVLTGSAVALAYFASLCLPALSTPDNDGSRAVGINGTRYGYELLLAGILCLLNPPSLANILFLTGMVFLFFRFWRTALALGLGALLLAVGGTLFLMAGNKGMELLIGFYVWVSSMALLAFAAFFGEVRSRVAKARAGGEPAQKGE
jgi:hypothetical protein